MQFADSIVLTGQSMATSFSSPPVNVSQVHSVTLRAKWTGTAVGTLFMQLSCDPPTKPGSPTATGWTECDGTEVAVNGPGDFAWIDATGRSFLRIGYTSISGTGSLDLNWYGSVP